MLFLWEEEWLNCDFWQRLWNPGLWDRDNGDKEPLLSMLYMPQPSCKHPTFVEKAPKPVEHKTVTPKWANFTKCQPIQPNEYDSRFKEFIIMQWISIKNHFLDSSSHPYKRVHPSIRLYVGPLCLFIKSNYMNADDHPERYHNHCHHRHHHHHHRRGRIVGLLALLGLRNRIWLKMV